MTLRHLASGTVVRVATFGDGTFFASGLRPGAWIVALAPDALAELGLRQPATQVTVRPFDPDAGTEITIELQPADE